MKFRACVRFVATLLLFSLLTVSLVPALYAAPMGEIRQTLENYFELRYSILQNLQMDDAIAELFVPGVLNKPSVLSEVDRLGALVAYRKAQSNDLSLLASPSLKMDFLAVEINGERAEVILVEEYEYYFTCAPTVPNRGSITHAFSLDGRGGVWRIVSDDYADPDGFNQMLDEIFFEPGMDKQGAVAKIIQRVQAADTAWNERFSSLMEPYPNLLVFMNGQSYAWLAGRVQRLDSLNMVTPVFYDQDLYLPLRVIVEAMGGSVTWSADSGMISANYDEHTLLFQNNSAAIQLDGVAQTMKRPVPLLEDRVMLPATVIGDLLQRTQYLDSAGLVILAEEALSAEQQAELHNKLSALYLARFSIADFPRVDGSTATYPYTVAFGKHLLGLDETAVRGYLTHNTTHNAYVNLLEHQADIILVTPPSEEELALAEAQGIELEVIPICKEGFVFLVNDQNPVQSLTTEQIVQIYQGKIANWKEVGGEDLPLIAYQREANSGSQTLMEQVVMQGQPLTSPPRETMVYGMGSLIDRVADYSNARGALGYSVYYYATSMYTGRAVRLLAVNGVEPNYDTLLSGSYPYTASYYAVLRKDEPVGSPARRLLAWLLGEEGQEVAKEAGFVPLA